LEIAAAGVSKALSDALGGTTAASASGDFAATALDKQSSSTTAATARVQRRFAAILLFLSNKRLEEVCLGPSI
jgi:hypothetical protein